MSNSPKLEQAVKDLVNRIKNDKISPLEKLELLKGIKDGMKSIELSIEKVKSIVDKN